MTYDDTFKIYRQTLDTYHCPVCGLIIECDSRYHNICGLCGWEYDEEHATMGEDEWCSMNGGSRNDYYEKYYQEVEIHRNTHPLTREEIARRERLINEAVARFEN